jgi:hypothetical protein
LWSGISKTTNESAAGSALQGFECAREIDYITLPGNQRSRSYERVKA